MPTKTPHPSEAVRAALSPLDRLPGGASYRAFVEAVADEAHDPAIPPGSECEAYWSRRYAGSALVLLGLAARVWYDVNPAQRGRAAALLSAAITTDEEGPYSMLAEVVFPHIRRLPRDPAADVLREVVRPTQGHSAYPARHRPSFWMGAPSPELPAAVRYAVRHLRRALASPVDAVRAALLALPLEDRIDLASSFCLQCGEYDADAPHCAMVDPPCSPARRGEA